MMNLRHARRAAAAGFGAVRHTQTNREQIKRGETEETQASFLISPTREAGRGGEEETRGIIKSNFNKSKTSFLLSRHVKVLSVNYYLWHSLLLYFTIPDATHL